MHGLARRHAMLTLAAVALAATTFLAAGCGGDDDDDAAPTSAAAATKAATVAAPTISATTAATAAATAEVTAAAGGTIVMVAEGAAAAGGALLTDGDGRTLYTFNNDTAGSGTSACTGGCAQAWPPLLAGSTSAPTAGAGVTGTLATIPSGSDEQVTYNGLPLYYFTSDAAPGDTNGKAIPNWTLAAP